MQAKEKAEKPCPRYVDLTDKLLVGKAVYLRTNTSQFLFQIVEHTFKKDDINYAAKAEMLCEALIQKTGRNKVDVHILGAINSKGEIDTGKIIEGYDIQLLIGGFSPARMKILNVRAFGVIKEVIDPNRIEQLPPRKT